MNITEMYGQDGDTGPDPCISMLEREIYTLKAERERTIKTLELIGKGLAYENVTKAKTQSAGNALMEIARKLRGEK